MYMMHKMKTRPDVGIHAQDLGNQHRFKSIKKKIGFNEGTQAYPYKYNVWGYSSRVASANTIVDFQWTE